MNDCQFTVLRIICAALFTSAMFLVPLLEKEKHFFRKFPILGTVIPALIAILNIGFIILLPKPEERSNAPPRRHKWIKKTVVDVAMLLFGFGFNYVSDGSYLMFATVILLSGYGLVLMWIGVPCLQLEFTDVLLGLLLEVCTFNTHPFERAISITVCLVFVALRARVHFRQEEMMSDP